MNVNAPQLALRELSAYARLFAAQQIAPCDQPADMAARSTTHSQLYTTNAKEYNRRVRRIAQKSVDF